MDSRNKRLVELSAFSDALFDWQVKCQARYQDRFEALRSEQVRSHRAEYNALTNESLCREYRDSKPHAIGFTTAGSQRQTIPLRKNKQGR